MTGWPWIVQVIGVRVGLTPALPPPSLDSVNFYAGLLKAEKRDAAVTEKAIQVMAMGYGKKGGVPGEHVSGADDPEKLPEKSGEKKSDDDEKSAEEEPSSHTEQTKAGSAAQGSGEAVPAGSPAVPAAASLPPPPPPPPQKVSRQRGGSNK